MQPQFDDDPAGINSFADSLGSHDTPKTTLQSGQRNVVITKETGIAGAESTTKATPEMDFLQPGQTGFIPFMTGNSYFVKFE